MKSMLTPHTTRWFELLRKRNPGQATHTRRILQLAGRTDVCSVCGARPEGDYLLGRLLRWTLRLCPTCCKLHSLFGLPLQRVADDARAA